MSSPPVEFGRRSGSASAGGVPVLGPTYRQRLRVEGAALAACGLVGSVVLVLADERATDHGLSTVSQLVVVLLLLAWFGPRSVHKAVAQARPAGEVEPTGEPTPLWQLPLIVVGLAAPLALLGAWDAGLRVTGGCLLVGLAQAVLLARAVAGHEREAGRVYVRAPGSRLFRGTRLAWASSGTVGAPAQPRI